MKKFSPVIQSTAQSMIKGFVTIAFVLVFTIGYSQSSTPTSIPSGSFIVNLGITPQTIANGLKPYGMVYDLLANYHVPVSWIINSSKVKDGIDFSYNGTDYKGGSFIILAGFRTSAVNARITYWQGLGVVGVTTNSATTVPLYATLYSAPRWTLDHQNGAIAVNFFNNAGIPSTAYGGSSSSAWPYPSQLTCCDDIFVMPHADPTWATHQHLLDWNLTCKGYIWLGCHAGSALNDMFDNVTPDYSKETNFLVSKTGPASGAGPYSQNSLILWGNHSSGTPPYTYDYPTDPVMQFIGTLDAATQNGSEQVYLPYTTNAGANGGWLATTKVGVSQQIVPHPNRMAPINDPKTLPAILAWGYAFGDENRGKEMMEASHNIANSTGTANVAAQRAFFNFSFQSGLEKTVAPAMNEIPNLVFSGTPYTLTFTLPAGASISNYTILWSSGCGGTFTPNATSQTVQWTPPTVAVPTTCSVSVQITDACGRITFDTHIVTIQQCSLSVTPTVTKPTCFGGADGAISMVISGGSAPFSWSWSRTNPTGGPTTGSGTSITGLIAGTYTVTVTNSAGCSGTFTSQVTQPAQLTATKTIFDANCFGGNGSIDLTVVGGTVPYTYSWADLPGSPDPEDRTGIAAGTYTVTVTDSKGCTASVSAAVGQPISALNLSATQTNVSCYGGSNGAIDLTVTGGTSPYTYNWGSGITTEDRTALIAGTYTVIVTDAKGCTATLSKTIPPPTALSLSSVLTPETCPGNANGAINLIVSGGTPTYTYSWADMPGSPDPEDRTGLTAGTYSVIVTDTNGCSASLSAIITTTNPNPVKPGTITK